LHLWGEETVSQCHFVPEAIFPFTLLQKSFKGVHSPQKPIFGEFNLISIEFSVNFLQKSLREIGVHA
jgi:hypothetical protein